MQFSIIPSKIANSIAISDSCSVCKFLNTQYWCIRKKSTQCHSEERSDEESQWYQILRYRSEWQRSIFRLFTISSIFDYVTLGGGFGMSFVLTLEQFIVRQYQVWIQARSSGGEHHLDTVGVQGSNPCVPTIFGPLVVKFMQKWQERIVTARVV